MSEKAGLMVLRVVVTVLIIIMMGFLVGSVIYTGWLLEHRPSEADETLGFVPLLEQNNHGKTRVAYVTLEEKGNIAILFGNGLIFGILVAVFAIIERLLTPKQDRA